MVGNHLQQTLNAIFHLQNEKNFFPTQLNNENLI